MSYCEPCCCDPCDICCCDPCCCYDPCDPCDPCKKTCCYICKCDPCCCVKTYCDPCCRTYWSCTCRYCCVPTCCSVKEKYGLNYDYSKPNVDLSSSNNFSSTTYRSSYRNPCGDCGV